MVSSLRFQKPTVYFFFGFFNKDYTFCIKNLFFYNERRPKYRKNPDFSNIFIFPSVMHRNYEYNLRIFANFRVKTLKSTDFAYTFSKNYSFLFVFFFNEDYTFYTKNLFFYNERCPKFCKNQFSSNMFTFLSVICQNFEYSFRILANFRLKTQKSMEFAFIFSLN